MIIRTLKFCFLLSALSPPEELLGHQTQEEEEGQHVGNHQHVEDPAPVIVPGQSPGQEGTDGGPDAASAVNDGGDGGQGLAAASKGGMLS